MGFLSDIMDNVFGIDPAPATPTAQQTAAQLQKQREKETQLRIIEAAREADRMRGRRGASFNGVTGDPTFGQNVANPNPVATFAAGSRTALGR